MLRPFERASSKLAPKPIARIVATIQRAGRQEQNEMRALGDFARELVRPHSGFKTVNVAEYVVSAQRKFAT